MKFQSVVNGRKSAMVVILLDLAALALIYFIPAIVHLTRLPVYMIEPMRLMLFLSIAHTPSYNAYLLAATLPLFSFLVSGHPFLIKMIIITGELILNVFLFFLLMRKTGKPFISAFLSILGSKAVCYAAYAVFFSAAFLREEAAGAFLLIQVATAIIFSSYITLFMKRSS